ncbi:hypothetical protein KSS87_023729 [Heliosperma pusillum]|nr:hypothetical protein KSS87_023902 [Heliosperma pusillum]KAH9627041.1 hypothetical protein KSS87_023729 [Heliosperma pusillum]
MSNGLLAKVAGETLVMVGAWSFVVRKETKMMKLMLKS